MMVSMLSGWYQDRCQGEWRFNVMKRGEEERN